MIEEEQEVRRRRRQRTPAEVQQIVSEFKSSTLEVDEFLYESALEGKRQANRLLVSTAVLLHCCHVYANYTPRLNVGTSPTTAPPRPRP